MLEINRKFANRVVHNVGLCIRLFDILEAGEPFVLPNDGSTYTRVVFRMVVFRPYIGEVLIGKIRHSSAEGITGEVPFNICGPVGRQSDCRLLLVTLGFFDDIQIPASNFQEGTAL